MLTTYPGSRTPPNDSSKTKATDRPVSGVYRLYCTNRLDPVDASNYCFEIHHITQAPGQLFATFEFGNLKGIMRLCPEKALTSRPDKSLTLKYFDDACKLDGETQPSPTFKNWLVRIPD
jgi:hypothetical protein